MPEHRHAAQEAFYVLESEFSFQVGDELISGSVGTFVNIPYGIPRVAQCRAITQASAVSSDSYMNRTVL